MMLASRTVIQMSRQELDDIPEFVKGRKGQLSVVDAMVRSLWLTQDGEWPEKTFDEIRIAVSTLQGYPISSSTIRASTYQHSDVFERVGKKRPIRLRLTEYARTRQRE